MLVLLTSLVLPALADIPMPSPPGERFVSHELEVQGLADHPGWVVLALDDGDTFSAYRWFDAENPGPKHLATGGGGRHGALYSPRLKLLPREAFQTWKMAADAEVARQEEACADRSEGCAHISRFKPKYPAPTGTLDCGFPIDLVRTGPEDGPDTFRQVVRLKAASETECTLEPVSSGMVPEDPPFEPPAETEAGGCSTSGGAPGSWAVLALGLLGLRRRRL